MICLGMICLLTMVFLNFEMWCSSEAFKHIFKNTKLVYLRSKPDSV